MRTKALILTAAVTAAGIATSTAQVFSVNAVGYVNTTIPAGKFALISNPLTAADNTIGALFGSVPPGTQLYKFRADASGWDQGIFDDIDNAILPESFANTELLPGEGIFVRNNSNSDFTVTFVGEVPQGDLTNPVPQGLSVRSSQVPQSGTLTELGVPGNFEDVVFKWDPANNRYDQSIFDDIDNDWVPQRTLGVGEAIFINKKAAGSWDRSFSVNTP